MLIVTAIGSAAGPMIVEQRVADLSPPGLAAAALGIRE